MSSKASKNEKEKNKSIDLFSSNFNKCYNKLKYSKKNSETNNNINNTTNNVDNNNLSLQTNISKTKNAKSSPLKQFEYTYNESKIPNAKQNIKQIQNSSLNNKPINKTNKINNIKLETNTNKPKEKQINKKVINNEKIKNVFNSPSPMNITASNKSKLYQNKFKSRQPEEKKLKRNKSQTNNLELFLQNVKEHQKKREENLNKIRNKSLDKESSELQQKPKISKNSQILLKNIKREPLYQKQPLNEEKKLDKNFLDFYTKNFEDNKDNHQNNSSNILYNKTVDEKFSKFYQCNLKWKKDIEEKNNEKRNSKNKKYEECLGNYTFTPILNKNSMTIVDNKNKIIYNNNNEINVLYFDDEYYDKEIIDRIKIKLKPYINSYYSMNMPYMYKKKMLNKTASDSDLRKNMYHNYNYKTNKTARSKNNKINYKMDEKKYKKKEEHKNMVAKTDKQKKKIKLNKKDRDYYLLTKIKELQKDTGNKKKELYKLNIRQGTSWNLDAVNNVIPAQKCGHIIEGLL